MKQSSVLDNACGIIACIHCILNNLGKVEVGADSLLDKYYKETQGKTPEECCTILETSTDF